MATATITTKGQTTIPKAVRDRLHLEPGDRVEFVVQEDGTALMIPATLTLAELKGTIPPPPRALSLEEMDQALAARAAERARRR
ncbi:MAG TPA: AbrB/MazE/SpoVT family DNA-binding domain-containing protein [Rhodospirillales bacterium]|nr:AbrB/MazE/SpoVT family DNA-binding domain-containing protein [Rhodospirillales bacterium]